MNPIQWFGSLFAPAEKHSLSPFDLITMMAGGPTYAGPQVNEESALRYGAVYACVRIISESIASLPLPLMRQDGRNKERAENHPLYTVLHDMANPNMTSFEWRELMFSHVLTWGNGYSLIEKKEANGQIMALWPLRPDKMENIRHNADGRLEYVYRQPDNTLRLIPSYLVHHIRGPGDQWMGHSPIQIAARQATGLGLATEEYGARFFSNGARPGAVLKHPGKLSPQAYERLTASFSAENQGLSNSHRTKILEEGMDIATIGIPPNEAQFLETRKFQVTEIARIYRVPPHMLADLDRATFSNIEHQSLNFVQYTLLPWLVRHEQAISRDLLTPQERIKFFAKYVVAGMLRGDMASRSQAYTTGINAGYLTRNEARELEDLNPLAGLDAPLVPLNMSEVGAPPPAPANPTQPPSRPQRDLPIDAESRAAGIGAQRRALMNRHVRLYEDVASRVTKREVANIRKALPKLSNRSTASFEKWLAGFYEELRRWLPDYFRALMVTYYETIMDAIAQELGGKPAPLDDAMIAWIEEYLLNFTEVYAVGGERQLRTLLAESKDTEQAAAAIEERMVGWEETKASKTGLEQAFEAGNALSVLGYTVGGVTILRWSAHGKSCPLCQRMNGKRVKTGDAFLNEGDQVTAEGVDPLPIIRTIKHAPLHAGCDCSIVAG